MDFTIPITGGSVAVAISIVVWWFARERMADAKNRRDMLESIITSHIALCNEKNISHARLEEKVIRIDEKLDDMKEAMTSRTSKIDNMDEKIDRLTDMVMIGNRNKEN